MPAIGLTAAPCVCRSQVSRGLYAAQFQLPSFASVSRKSLGSAAPCEGPPSPRARCRESTVSTLPAPVQAVGSLSALPTSNFAILRAGPCKRLPAALSRHKTPALRSPQAAWARPARRAVLRAHAPRQVVARAHAEAQETAGTGAEQASSSGSSVNQYRLNFLWMERNVAVSGALRPLL